VKVSSLPRSSCRKARLRLRLGKLRFERFPHANASLVSSSFVSSQHRLQSDCISNNRRRPTQADLGTTDLKTDDLEVDGDDILVVDTGQ
jgi:hypothetical protein